MLSGLENASISFLFSYNKNQQDALILKFILIKNSICFVEIYCPSSGVSTLYTQQSQHCIHSNRYLSC